MAASGDASIWAVLLPVMIGGGLTLVGTAIGPVVGLWWTDRRDRRQKRRDRIETLVDQLFAYDGWLDLKKDERLFGGKVVETPSPFNRALMIAVLHFKPIVGDIRKFEAIARQYEVWILAATLRRMGGDMATVNEGFAEHYGAYAHAFAELLNRISEFAENDESAFAVRAK